MPPDLLLGLLVFQAFNVSHGAYDPSTKKVWIPVQHRRKPLSMCHKRIFCLYHSCGLTIVGYSKRLRFYVPSAGGINVIGNAMCFTRVMILFKSSNQGSNKRHAVTVCRRQGICADFCRFRRINSPFPLNNAENESIVIRRVNNLGNISLFC